MSASAAATPSGATPSPTSRARADTMRRPATGRARAISPAGSAPVPVGQHDGDAGRDRGQREQERRHLPGDDGGDARTSRTGSAATARRPQRAGGTAMPGRAERCERGRRAAAGSPPALGVVPAPLGSEPGGRRAGERRPALRAGSRCVSTDAARTGSSSPAGRRPVRSDVRARWSQQCLPQLGAGPAHSALHGAARDAEQRGRLAGGQAVDDGGLDDGAQLGERRRGRRRRRCARPGPGPAPPTRRRRAAGGLNTLDHVGRAGAGGGAATGSRCPRARPPPHPRRASSACARRRRTCPGWPRRPTRGRGSAAPAARPAMVRGGRTARAGRRGRSRTAATSSASVACAQSSYVSIACTPSCADDPA